jgi:hypothetical protein
VGSCFGVTFLWLYFGVGFWGHISVAIFWGRILGLIVGSIVGSFLGAKLWLSILDLASDCGVRLGV